MLSVMTLCASAQQEVDGIFYNFNQDAMTAEVVENYDYYSGKIVIPETVEFEGSEYKVTSIGDFSFYDCGSLSQVQLPASITSIGQYAFENCSSLKSINIPVGVTRIGEHAFGECIDLTKMEVPATVKEMGAGVFGGCNSLTDIKLNEGLGALGTEAFTRCSALESIVVPGSVKNIDPWAFSYCIALKDITIGEGIGSVGEAAFAYCTSLEDIKMPSTVKSIEKQAFSNCEVLGRVVLSKELESLGDRVFDSCEMLAAIKCNSMTPAKVFNDKILDIYALTQLYVPQGAKAAYQGAGAWKNFTAVAEADEDTEIKEQLKRFQADDINYVVCDFNNIAKVVKKGGIELYSGIVKVPATVTNDGKVYDVKYIGTGAFEYSNALSEIVFPESIEAIGEWAFSGCVALYDVKFPASIRSIGAQAFYSCNALGEITIPAGVQYIGDCAFAGCFSLFTINSEIIDPFIILENTFDFREDQTLYVPEGCKQDYKSTDFWWRFENIVEDNSLSIDGISAESVSDGIFYDMQGRRVETPVKGCVYICNGKKVIF